MCALEYSIWILCHYARDENFYVVLYIMESSIYAIIWMQMAELPYGTVMRWEGIPVYSNNFRDLLISYFKLITSRFATTMTWNKITKLVRKRKNVTKSFSLFLYLRFFQYDIEVNSCCLFLLISQAFLITMPFSLIWIPHMKIWRTVKII